MTDLLITGFIQIRWIDIVDILLVALLLYELYKLLKGTVAINIFFGIVAVVLIWQVVNALQMELLSQILGAFISVGFIALIVIFQPEIRRFLLALGTTTFMRKRGRRFLFWRFNFDEQMEIDADAIVMACNRMGEAKQGALLIITRKNELKQYVNTGEILNARLSTPLIENIFYGQGPLHDGAMIISGNTIMAAACILPVSGNSDIPKRLGLRHRAAVGITEVSDAIAIVVSEETGKIRYAVEGKLSPKVDVAELKSFLEEEFTENPFSKEDPNEEEGE
ncbi:MAG: diadenylate cyclase CdaA [Bacteroidales bacterium]|nr:diadenylate cyclase CdaA [Bacteroidales bacterium]